ncbi:MAG: inorganic triphosphatase [Aeromonas sp.]
MTQPAATETELKFLIRGDFLPILLALLARWQVTPLAKTSLSNRYFDTPALDLRRLGMGLRIRRWQDEHGAPCAEQTLKCRGQGLGGLHTHPEFNLPVGERPDLFVFPTEIWPIPACAAQLNAQLQPLFSTDFVRQAWLIEFDGAQIELVWDQGEVVGRVGREAINELELELKRGPVAALFALAQQLVAHGHLLLGIESKAARGYRAAGLSRAPTSRALPALEGLTARDKVQLGLEHWQYHAALMPIEPSSAACAAAVSEGLALLHSAVLGLASAPAWRAPLQSLPRQADLAAQASLQLAIIDWLISAA